MENFTIYNPTELHFGKDVIKELNLKEGDLVSVSFKKISNIITIKCPVCGAIFSTKEGEVYDCPVCGLEILDINATKIEI